MLADSKGDGLGNGADMGDSGNDRFADFVGFESSNSGSAEMFRAARSAGVFPGGEFRILS